MRTSSPSMAWKAIESQLQLAWYVFPRAPTTNGVAIDENGKAMRMRSVPLTSAM